MGSSRHSPATSLASQSRRLVSTQLKVAPPDPRQGIGEMTLRALLALSLLFACVSPGDARESGAQVPAAVQERLALLLPTGVPAGLVADQPPAFYDSPTLYQYMDGAADAFQGYDVQALLHHEARAGAVDLTIDIFDMGSARERVRHVCRRAIAGYDFVTIGTEGYRNEGILNFFQDRYYVKLAGFGEGADAALQQFGRGHRREDRRLEGLPGPALESCRMRVGRRERSATCARTRSDIPS